MDRFKKILFLCGDTSAEPGFSCALDLARRNGATVTALSVVPRTEDMGRPGFLPGSDRIRERLVGVRHRSLRTLEEWGASEGVRVTGQFVWGWPAPVVLHQVVREGHDLVIKAGDDHRGLRARLFGSTDRTLMRTCPCPVWILDPAQRGGFGVVLAAVDVGRSSLAPLNRKIVRLASSLAVREGADLWVVHAWSTIGESILRSRMRGMGPSRLTGVLDRISEERRRRLHDLLADQAPGDDARTVMEKGDPARVIRGVAREVGADVLVVGSVARTGVEALLLGNVAEDLLGRVHSAILTVKADDFTCPEEIPDAVPSRAWDAPERTGRPGP